MKIQLIETLKSYKKEYIVPDLLSGLLVAIIALPLSIALGLQSVPDGIDASGIQMGIITAIVAGFIISAFGGSRFQIGGPTAAFVIIIVSYLADPDIGLLGLQIATITAGVILIILGITKCGNVIKYIPFPIVVGFTTGIGITLLVGQLKDFASFDITSSEFGEKIIELFTNLDSFHLATFLIGALALAIIIVVKKINKKIPSAFIAVIACTVLCVFIAEPLGIATIETTYGEITASFNFIDWSGITDISLTSLIVPAITIAFLGGLESLLSAKVADGLSKTKHNPNAELLGQGFANIGSSLLGGLPATGAIARTSANISSGAKTCLAGIYHALFILLMYFALMGVMQYIPLTVLAAILINVSIGICNFKLFFMIAKFGFRDGFVLIATCLLTVFFDLTYGVIGGIVLTLLLNIYNIRKGLSVKVNVTEERTTIFLNGSLYFISINKLIPALNDNLKLTDTVYIDFENIDTLDATAMEKLTKYNSEVKKLGKNLEFINYNTRINRRLDRYFKHL